MAFYKSKRKAWSKFSHHSGQKEPTLWTPWFQTFRFQKWETMYFCCLNHPVCGTLLWKPKLTNTAPSGDPFIYDPDSIPSSSGYLWNISIYMLVPLPFSFLSHQPKVVSPLTTRKQKTQTTQSILTQNNNLVTNDPFKSLFSPSLTKLKVANIHTGSTSSICTYFMIYDTQVSVTSCLPKMFLPSFLTTFSFQFFFFSKSNGDFLGLYIVIPFLVKNSLSFAFMILRSPSFASICPLFFSGTFFSQAPFSFAYNLSSSVPLPGHPSHYWSILSGWCYPFWCLL